MTNLSDTSMNVNRFYKVLCGHRRTHLYRNSKVADNKKINANFLFGDFIKKNLSKFIFLKHLKPTQTPHITFGKPTATEGQIST